ncbi:hypothetical protein T439DRAFT_326001 [Meredithblackwellia eburnea MCA 4105]
MNQAQEDEIMALEAIYPSCVTYSTSASLAHISIKLPTIDLGSLYTFEVWDWIEPAPSTSRSSEPTRSKESQGKHTFNKQASSAGASKPVSPIITSQPSTTSKDPRRRNRNRNKGKQPAVEGVTTPPPPRPPQGAPGHGRRAPVRNQQTPESPPTPIKTSPPSPPPTITSPAIASKAALKLVPAVRPPPPPSPTLAELNTVEVALEVEVKPNVMELQYLPSLELVLELPAGYPEVEPPKVALNDPQGWLQQGWKSKIESGMEGAFVGGECLWLMVEQLQGEQLKETLDFKPAITLRETRPKSSRPPLSTRLQQHNRLSSSTAFSSENFDCGICLEAKKGAKCVRLDVCGHVFCLPCLHGYFHLLISEGLIRSVHCPSPECITARQAYSKANPPTAAGQMEKVFDPARPGEVDEKQLEGIVGPELVKRWKVIGEKIRVESDPSMAFCPRESCQAPVPRVEEDVKLRICSACSYAFCVFCEKGWHGTQTPCSLPHSSRIVSEYLHGDPSQQAELELRYGKSNIVRLVAIWEEDRINREYMEQNSTACPGCQVPVEKSMGCNHMTCARCSTHFCFRCGDKISGLNPYTHFSTPSFPCYNKLFDFQPGNEPEPDQWLDIIGDDL